uniref:NAC protein n=1 Tax=Lilium pumilum TaxID=82327 RepID=A0A4Y1P0P0_9LILI|nr:NAC protein [Lilium pumilum]
MGLRGIEATLPPGFRFCPSDEELVCHYLYKKVVNEKIPAGTMVEVDLHARDPWELPEVAKLSGNEWYFFSFRDRKYATGVRANRATKTGYWKATGKDRTVYSPAMQTTIGMRKTLVFYHGRAPKGMKSRWVMHEFRLESPLTPPKEDWVLCRVFHKRKAESEQDSAKRQSPALGLSPPHMYQQVAAALYDDQISSSFKPDTPIQEGSSNTVHNMALMQYNFLGFPCEVETTPILGDEFGFLLDEELEEFVEGGLSFPSWQ